MGIRGLIPNWQAIIEHTRPDVIISFGFCGEILNSTEKGIYLSNQFWPIPINHFFQPVNQSVTEEILEFCFGRKVNPAISVSTPVFISKSNLLKLIKNLLPEKEVEKIIPSSIVIDMESAIIANFALREGIPVLSFRISTDARDEEIPFDVEKLLDARGFISLRKVVFLLKTRPLLISSFLHFWKTSRSSAGKLAEVLVEFIGLPLPYLNLEPPKIRRISE